MGLISVLWGIVSMLLSLLFFFPLLGWGNWFVIPFAVIGTIIAALGIAFSSPGNRGRAKAGLVMNGLVILVGIVRLSLGGGLF